MLISVLKVRRCKIIFEHCNQISFCERAIKAHGIVIRSKHAVHGGAVLHGGGNFAGNSPLALQLELKGTSFVALYGTGA